MWLRLITIIISTLLIWQVVVQGLGRRASERLSSIYFPSEEIPWTNATNNISPQSKLKLTSDAWVSLSDQALIRQNYINAKYYAFRSINRNLSNARPISRLLIIKTKENPMENLDYIANLTEKLWPTHSDTLVEVSDYWLSKKDYGKLLGLYHKILTEDYRYKPVFFPNIIQLAQLNSGYSHLVEQYANSTTSWWPDFFEYLVNQEKTLEIIQHYYSVRTANDKKPTAKERIVYIEKLIKEKKWLQAREIWISSLSDEMSQKDTLLFDGSFDSNIKNEGFSWHVTQNKSVVVDLGSNDHKIKNKQLKINFKNDKSRINFNIAWQRITLSPGNYELKFKYNLENLENPKGVKWRIRCNNQQTVLLESNNYKGTTEWKEELLKFSVPELSQSDDNKQIPSTDAICDSQTLSLEASSQFAHEHLFSGKVQFDDFSIIPIN